MKEVETEAQGRDLEVIPQQEPSKDVQLNQDKFEAVLKFADNAERNAKALDTIRDFMMKRAFPGDFVQFEDKLSLSGPASERMVSALALMGVSVSFTSWRSWKDTGEDKNGKWFTWYYEANVNIGGLYVEGVQGRAGSRDRFFGYEHGQWKDLGDVKESDVRQAARRGVIKEGISLALGLRGIPVEHAASIGLDSSKIKKVEYGSSKKGTAASGAADEFIAKVLKVGVKRKTEKWTIYAVAFNNNVTAETFDKKIAEKAAEFQKSGAEAFARTTAAKSEKYAPTLAEIMTATEDHRKALAPKTDEPEKQDSPEEPVY